MSGGTQLKRHALQDDAVTDVENVNANRGNTFTRALMTGRDREREKERERERE